MPGLLFNMVFAAAALLFVLPAALGQFLATDYLDVATFNNSFNAETDVVYAAPGVQCTPVC